MKRTAKQLESKFNRISEVKSLTERKLHSLHVIVSDRIESGEKPTAMQRRIRKAMRENMRALNYISYSSYWEYQNYLNTVI